MADFRFHYPIQVRYSDLDAQWHVNNARYLTYLEQARVAYLQHLGLWDGHSFFDIGLIIGDIHIRYLEAVTLDQKIRVDMRIAEIGRRSITGHYRIVDETTERAVAKAEIIQVAYDYRQKTSIPVPDSWRVKIEEFEGLAGPAGLASLAE
jgi:acyl-CoA thioester hydrolase